MEALLFSGGSGSIERVPVSNFDFARDLARVLVAIRSSDVYRVQIVAGERVLWDSDDRAIEHGTVVWSRELDEAKGGAA